MNTILNYNFNLDGTLITPKPLRLMPSLSSTLAK
jgi:hypothetical protein